MYEVASLLKKWTFTCHIFFCSKRLMFVCLLDASGHLRCWNFKYLYFLCWFPWIYHSPVSLFLMHHIIEKFRYIIFTRLLNETLPTTNYSIIHFVHQSFWLFLYLVNNPFFSFVIILKFSNICELHIIKKMPFL